MEPSEAMRLMAAGTLPDPPPSVVTSFDVPGIAAQIEKAENIIVMTGAGISVSAGIPDFRTPGTGLYDNLQKYDLPSPQHIFEINFFKENPAAFYMLAKELFPGTFLPTPAHFFIKLLAEKKKLLRCFTQNIDSLEAVAGIDKDLVVAAHGNFDSAKCIATGEPIDPDEVRESILAGEAGWRSMAERHGGLVKPDIVFFGESLPPRFFKLMKEDFPLCDLLIVMGTSLVVHPFASLIDAVGESVPRLLINREPAGVTSQPQRRLLQLIGQDAGFDFDEETRWRDVFLEGDCDDGARRLARQLGWEAAFDKLIADGATDFHHKLDATATVANAKAPLLAIPTEDAPAALDASVADLTAPLSGLTVSTAAAGPFANREHVSGHWRGTRSSSNDVVVALEWTLVLKRDGAITAFGAGLRPGTASDGTASDGGDDGEELAFGSLIGSVDLAAGTAELTESYADGQKLVFTADLEASEDGATVLKGTWVDTTDPANSGGFAVELQPAADVGHAGLWIGEAVPDPAFADDVPTNPIVWALTYRRSPPPEMPHFWGAGYFDDAGDIPGSPVLFYTLQGGTGSTSTPDGFVKRYSAPVPAELSVNYTGIKTTGEGGVTLVGQWANPLEGCFGNFGAQLQGGS